MRTELAVVFGFFLAFAVEASQRPLMLYQIPKGAKLVTKKDIVLPANQHTWSPPSTVVTTCSIKFDPENRLRAIKKGSEIILSGNYEEGDYHSTGEAPVRFFESRYYVSALIEKPKSLRAITCFETNGNGGLSYPLDRFIKQYEEYFTYQEPEPEEIQ